MTETDNWVSESFYYEVTKGWHLDEYIRAGSQMLRELFMSICELQFPLLQESTAPREDSQRGAGGTECGEWEEAMRDKDSQQDHLNLLQDICHWRYRFQQHHIVVLLYEVGTLGYAFWQIRMRSRLQLAHQMREGVAHNCGMVAYVVGARTPDGVRLLKAVGYQNAYGVAPGTEEVYVQILLRGKGLTGKMRALEDVLAEACARHWDARRVLPLLPGAVHHGASSLAGRWDPVAVRENLVWYLSEIPWSDLGAMGSRGPDGVDLVGVKRVLVLTDSFGPIDEAHLPRPAQGRLVVESSFEALEAQCGGPGALREALFIVFFQDDMMLASALQRIVREYSGARYSNAWLGWWNHMHLRENWYRPAPMSTLSQRDRSSFMHLSAATRTALGDTVAGGFRQFEMASHEALCQALTVTLSVPGSFVEVGVFDGGSAFTALSFMHYAGLQREAWLFDTFEGFLVDRPTADRRWDGTHQLYGSVTEWQAAVEGNLKRVRGNPKFHLWQLDVVSEAPMPAALQSVAVGNIDVDSFEATLAALHRLAPLVPQGGVLLCEDAVWTPWVGGALAAVEDFLSSSLGQQFRRWVLPTHHLLTRL